MKTFNTLTEIVKYIFLTLILISIVSLLVHWITNPSAVINATFGHF